MKVIYSIFFWVIFTILFISAFTLYAQVTTVDTENAYYVDKLFGTRFSFAPQSDQIMIKFAGKANGLQKSARSVIDSNHLETIHDAVGNYHFGVYKVPAGHTVSSISSLLKADPNVLAVCPVMTDQEGYPRYFIPNEFTVQFNETHAKDEMVRIIRSYGCTIIKEQWTYGYYTLSVPAGKELFETIRTFTDLPEVKFSELSYIGFKDYCFDPNDTFYAQQWALNNVGTGGGSADADTDAREGWDIERGDADILVVIIDTGVEWTHPDLRPNIAQNLFEDADADGHTIEFIGGNWVLDPGDLNGVDDDGNGRDDDLVGWDFVDDDNNPTPQAIDAADDFYPHGTCCAGIAAAVTDNNQGVAGIAHNCRLMGLRVNLYSGMNQNRADAINYATDFRFNYDGVVISCSWSASGNITAIHNAIVNARTNAVLCCFASGNGNTTPISYPARYIETMAVGATSECDERKTPTSCDGEFWWGSNYGDSLDIAAPGVNLYTTDIQGADGYGGGDYIADMNGTSGATPHVAGAAALLLSYDNSLAPADLQDILMQSADKVGGYDYSHDASRPGHSVELGYGRLNVNRALQMLMARTGGLTDLLPTPLDLVLSIDRSGSMVSAKLDAVQNAASQVVQLMNIGDNIGVTIYDDIAEPLFPVAGGVQEITSQTVKDDAITAIGSITRRGRTSIGGGLSFAQAQLATITTPNYPQAIILMSDGLSNEPPWILDEVPSIPATTEAYTIGFGTVGEDVDEDSLQWIASETDGLYFFAGADALLNQSEQNRISKAAASTGGLEIIKAYQASLNFASNRQIVDLFSNSFKEKFSEPINVDDSVYEMRFSFLGQEIKGEYTLILYSPTGKKIDPEAAEKDDMIDYIEGKTVRSYTVRKPEIGTWEMVGTGVGQRYFISASGYSYLKAILSIEHWGVCRPLLIKLRLIQLGEPVVKASVMANIGLPNNEYVQIELFDDGRHGDGLPQDGVFASFFDNTCREGSYTVETFTTGETKKDHIFNRYNMASVFLKKAPDLWAIKVSLPDMIAPAKNMVNIPIHINPVLFARGIQSFSTQIGFDSDVIKPSNEVLTRGTLCAEKWSVKINQPTENSIEINGTGESLEGSGSLVLIPFKVVGKKGDKSKLHFSEFIFKGTEKEYDTILINGSFKVGETFLEDEKTEIKENERPVPARFALLNNYPNPFNPETRIRYELAKISHVTLTVYNILGQKVVTLVDQNQHAGYYTTRWNGKDAYGLPVASGIYLYQLKTDHFVDVKKMYLLK
ncbi:S8 family serine peptidase [candidate division KSB1 bacterium]|nr:S8 family serine peptidase [candidate division KSB1 bacterium]